MLISVYHCSETSLLAWLAPGSCCTVRRVTLKKSPVLLLLHLLWKTVQTPYRSLNIRPDMTPVSVVYNLSHTRSGTCPKAVGMHIFVYSWIFELRSAF